MITAQQSRVQLLDGLSANQKKCYVKAEFYSVYPILLQLWRTPVKYSTKIKTELYEAKEACLRAFIRNLG